MRRIAKKGTQVHYPLERFGYLYPEVIGTPSVAVLARYGWAFLLSDPEPEVTDTQVAERGPVEWREDVPYWTWIVRNKTSKELSAEQEIKAETLRTKRNTLLKDTDWIVIYCSEKHLELPADWSQYRQALRDITEHPNFPCLTEEDWPIKP